jgi:outer membrane assembly lipoprotein YfiO
MKLMNKIDRKIIGAVVFVACLLICGDVFSFWIWSPETGGRWVRPRPAPAGNAEEQFKWAKKFYDSGEYKKAIHEFKVLTRRYHQSQYAAEAQFYTGDCYEKLGNHYQAFLAYQKVLDNYPYTERTKEIVARQYKIGELFFSGKKVKVAGMSVFPGIDKAIEIFGKVVDNAPYGEYADSALYKTGLCYRKTGDLDGARMSFERLINEFPKSNLIAQARFQLASCSYALAPKPQYDQEMTDKAIEEFGTVAVPGSEPKTEERARKAIDELAGRKAESLYEVGRFYEKQGYMNSAAIYYEEVVKKYPGTTWARLAGEKLKKIGNPRYKIDVEQ